MDISAFISQLQSLGSSPETIKAYRSDLSQFEAFLKERNFRVTQVRAKTLTEFVAWLDQRFNGKTGRQGMSQSTIRRRLAAVSSFYEYLRWNSNGKIHNPVKLIRRSRLQRAAPQPVNDELLAALLEGIGDPRDKALVALFVSTGLRLSELHQLNRNSIAVETCGRADGTSTKLGIGQVVGKGRKERTFFVDLETLKILGAYFRTRKDDDGEPLFLSGRNQRMSRRAIQERLHTWCRRLGLDRMRVHQLRHTYATRLANSGISSISLKELMGHSSFTTTQGYFKLGRPRLSAEYFAAMEVVQAKNAEPGQ